MTTEDFIIAMGSRYGSHAVFQIEHHFVWVTKSIARHVDQRMKR